MTRYAARVDAGSQSLVDCLRQSGCSVVLISNPRIPGVPDALVGFMGRNYLVEFKPPLQKGRAKAHSRPRATQEAWAEAWRGSKPFTLTEPAQAFELVAMWRAEFSRSQLAATLLAEEMRKAKARLEADGVFAELAKISRTPAEVEPRHEDGQQNQNTPSNKP